MLHFGMQAIQHSCGLTPQSSETHTMTRLLIACIAEAWCFIFNCRTYSLLRRSSMKQLVLLFAAVVILSCTSADANAQRLFGRIFRNQPTVQYRYTAPVTRSYSYTPTRTRVPQPVTGYGSNLHRNYMIRRAQQKTAITGIPPRNTGNILWAR